MDRGRGAAFGDQSITTSRGEEGKKAVSFTHPLLIYPLAIPSQVYERTKSGDFEIGRIEVPVTDMASASDVNPATGETIGQIHTQDVHPIILMAVHSSHKSWSATFLTPILPREARVWRPSQHHSVAGRRI
jgi:hypothetical protein